MTFWMSALLSTTFFMALSVGAPRSMFSTFIAFILIVIVTTTPGAASLDRRLYRGGG
jgi:uncharacterized membrane protein YphA (DoxX/SURF4 family)